MPSLADVGAFRKDISAETILRLRAMRPAATRRGIADTPAAKLSQGILA